MSNPKVTMARKKTHKATVERGKTLRGTKMNQAHPAARIMSYSDSLVILAVILRNITLKYTILKLEQISNGFLSTLFAFYIG